MTVNPEQHSRALTLALHEGLSRYVAERRERIPRLLGEHLSVQSCLRMQARHVVPDVFNNPWNTFWAIPYLSIRKGLELCEKLGLEFPKALIPAIPRGARTAFQKEVERQIQSGLFGLPENRHGRSDLAFALERDEQFRAHYESAEWRELLAKAEDEIRKLVTEYCNSQNGFNDLATSTAILAAAQYFFGDRSLDVFMMGRRWAALWSHRNAVNHFVFGRKIGREFYKIVHPPAPTSQQIWLATGIALALVAVFSTVVNIVSYPVQSGLGFQARQLDRLLQSVEDKLLLQLAKGMRSSAPQGAI